jgi:hypothetical protein
MAAFAIHEGYLNPARRELRFLIELAVQALFTDQEMGTSSFDVRLEFFKRKVNHSSADHIRDVGLGLLASRDHEFKQHVIKAWAAASTYVHPTNAQMRERFSMTAAGAGLGFETVEQLRSAVDEVGRVLGIGLVLCFHAIGQSFTGDFIVDGVDGDDTWPFHSDQFVAAIDEFFDYKHERQEHLAAIRARRARRLGTS